MYIGKVTYREYKKLEKLELKHENVYTMLEIIASFNDLDMIEVHIHKEVV